jgi:hypothetical protein
MRESFAKRIGAVCSVLAVAAVIAVPALVHAHYHHHPCGAGCAFQVKACQKTARASMLSCKMDCRANPDPNGLYGCLRGCRTTAWSNRGLCRSGLRGCIRSCEPNEPNEPNSPPPPRGCVTDCGQALGTCAHGVVSQAETCLGACRSASDRLMCVHACASQAQQGASSCASDFASCLSDCGVPPPPVPCLLSGPACGGTCRAGLSCQPSGTESLLACVCRPTSSPSGAFLN